MAVIRHSVFHLGLIFLLGMAFGPRVHADSPEQKIAFAKAYAALEAHCLDCHGAEKPKGRLALDSLDAMLKGGRSGKAAVVQGHADQSELIRRINLGTSHKEQMPKNGDSIPAADKLALTAWIDGGAVWFDPADLEDDMMAMSEEEMMAMHADLGVDLEEKISEEDAALFKEHIEPLFTSHCTGCHGGQKQKGGLRLDSKAFATAGGDTGPLWVAGKPAESELLIRLKLPADDDDVMPPSEKPRISAARLAKVEEWIKRGAPWPKPKSKLDRGGENHFTTFFAGLTAEEKEQLESLRKQGVFLEPLNWKGGGLRLVAAFAPSFDYEQIKLLDPYLDQIYWADFNRVRFNTHSRTLLGKLPNLVILHLERSDIGDADLDALPELPRLDYLNLHSTQVSKLEVMKKAPKLAKLYLWNTKVPAAAVKSLQQKQPGLKIVR